MEKEKRRLCRREKTGPFVDGDKRKVLEPEPFVS
jgi:hypothetical protein